MGLASKIQSAGAAPAGGAPAGGAPTGAPTGQGAAPAGYPSQGQPSSFGGASGGQPGGGFFPGQQQQQPRPGAPGQSAFPGQQSGQPARFNESGYPGQQGQQSSYPGQQGQQSSYPGQQSSYPGQQPQQGGYPGQQGQQQGGYPGQQAQPGGFQGQQGQQSQYGQPRPGASQSPSQQGAAGGGLGGGAGAGYGAGSAGAQGLQSKIENMVRTNRLEAFYPPNKLQQVLQRLQATDFRQVAKSLVICLSLIFAASVVAAICCHMAYYRTAVVSLLAFDAFSIAPQFPCSGACINASLTALFLVWYMSLMFLEMH